MQDLEAQRQLRRRHSVPEAALKQMAALEMHDDQFQEVMEQLRTYFLKQQAELEEQWHVIKR